MTRPYCIGLTGGICAGKSAATQCFAELGAGIVDTDVIAATLTAAGGSAVPLISAQFGETFIDANGALDRRAMRDQVFYDATKRHQLESILHPLIRQEAAKQVSCATAPYVVLAVPLLVENHVEYRGLIDRIVLIDCPEPIQLSRLLTRLGGDAKLAQAILASQSGRDRRSEIADDIVENSGDLAHLSRQIADLHHVYLQNAQRTGRHA